MPSAAKHRLCMYEFLAHYVLIVDIVRVGMSVPPAFPFRLQTPVGRRAFRFSIRDTNSRRHPDSPPGSQKLSATWHKMLSATWTTWDFVQQLIRLPCF